ncbi:AMP-binding protein [Dactylosporangium sp. AC04546]|uniref:AMP-binding protein n=1 Tax=Dactylosporangium sp. AC04546 TaxID=2862460 RepID=UPI001EDEDE8F|nr:AMP-binding protein [Dactylosporangium sp. AC04546]WVK79003.1 AMP-binding protein [Dactylosporangium sp. AC04546]
MDADEAGVLARGLTEIGLRPGGRVLIMLSGRPEQWLIDVAAVQAGATPLAVPPTLGTDQLRQLARHSAAQVLVLASPADLARWRPILPDLPSLRRIVLVGEPAPDDLSLATVSLAHVRSAGALARRADPGRRWTPV